MDKAILALPAVSLASPNKVSKTIEIIKDFLRISLIGQRQKIRQILQ
jgi:hypothetical protein